MNALIEARMQTRIDKVRLYNTLFDIGLTAVEETTGTVGEQQSDNMFVVASGRNSSYRYTVVCYDNDSQMVGITVDNVGPIADRIAHLSTELSNGEISVNESLYTIPRSMRSEVLSVFSAVYDIIAETEGLPPLKDEE
jgi:hypothetical protein